MWLGVRPIIRLASMPTASGRSSLMLTATTDGSLSTMPRPRTYTRVLAVPRSTAMSRPKKRGEEVVRHAEGLLVGGSEVVAYGYWAEQPRASPPRRHRRRPLRRSTATAVSAGKNSAISRSADSAPSEPWTRFSVVSMARSPRMVPGAAFAGLVAPISVRTTCQVSSGPSTTSSSDRRPGDEGEQIVVERLALVLRVVAAGELAVELAQLGRDQAQPLALQAADDLADEAPFDGVGLADDQGAVHERRRVADGQSGRRVTRRVQRGQGRPGRARPRRATR